MKQVKAGHSISIVAQFFDAGGNIGAAPDNKPGWSIDPVGGTLTVAADGMSAVFLAGYGLGLIGVTVECASGGVPKVHSEQIQIIPGDIEAILFAIN